MKLPRFHAPHATRSGTTIELPDDEAAHLTRVLRLTAGAPVRVFNGRGGEWAAIVKRAARQSVTVTLTETVAPLAEPHVALTLAVAVLKSDKMDGIVRDAVMLGVTAIQPLITARTEISAASVEKSDRVARWNRIAVASAKQSGRAVVPEVHGALALLDALERARTAVMLVEPAADTRPVSLHELRPVENATVFVGPEGGWSLEELECAVARGAMLMTLGGQTLRADAVPLVALTALRVHWGDF